MAQITIATNVTVDDTFSGRLPVRVSRTITYTAKHEVEKVLSTTTPVTLWDPINDGVGATQFTGCYITSNSTVGADIEFGAGATSVAVNFWTERVGSGMPILKGFGQAYQQNDTTGSIGAATDFLYINRIRANNPTTSTSVTVRIILVS